MHRLKMSNRNLDEVIQLAKQTIHQWDNHDKFRLVTNEDDAEPSKVLIARALLDYHNTNLQWTDERCEQLRTIRQILQTVAEANRANNFVTKMSEASIMAESLLNDQFDSFLTQLAIADRTLRKCGVAQ